MRKIIKYFKQKFCKHTYIPSTTLGYDVCIDCSKLRKK